MKKSEIHPEPKRNNRFVVNLLGTNIEPWSLTKIQRPTYTLGIGWGDIEFELLDLIGPQTSKTVFDEIINKKMTNCIIEIKMIDPTGEEVEKWTLTGDYVSIDFSNCDYAKDDLSSIKIIFKTKHCMLS